MGTSLTWTHFINKWHLKLSSLTIIRGKQICRAYIGSSLNLIWNTQIHLLSPLKTSEQLGGSPAVCGGGGGAWFLSLRQWRVLLCGFVINNTINAKHNHMHQHCAFIAATKPFQLLARNCGLYYLISRILRSTVWCCIQELDNLQGSTRWFLSFSIKMK